MKKFKEILNENNSGYYDHQKGVDLIVKDFSLIRDEMFTLEAVFIVLNLTKSQSYLGPDLSV
mgnify:CR=1 FL=1